jgi:hypothetical protein
MECQVANIFRQKLGRFICGNIFIGSLVLILEEKFWRKLLVFLHSINGVKHFMLETTHFGRGQFAAPQRKILPSWCREGS